MEAWGNQAARRTRPMFMKAQYETVATVLHEGYLATTPDNYVWWYENVYMPFVREFEGDNERFDTLTFSFAVATGKLPGRKLKGQARDNVERVEAP